MRIDLLEDAIIALNVTEGRKILKLKLRKVRFYDRVLKREFEFLTNLFEFRADMIATFYKARWQIELLFKQLKQNFPLKYFLRDNPNAIKIQISLCSNCESVIDCCSKEPEKALVL